MADCVNYLIFTDNLSVPVGAARAPILAYAPSNPPERAIRR